MKKLLGVFFALVLLVSFSLVTAVPAGAADPGDIELAATGDGTAEWSTEETHTGSYSVLLTAEYPYSASVGIPVNIPLAGIDQLSFWYNHKVCSPAAGHVLGPDLVLILSNGTQYYVAGRGGASSSVGSWLEADPITPTNFAGTSTWFCVRVNVDLTIIESLTPEGGYATFDALKVVPALADATVLYAAVNLDPPGDGSTGSVYVDDIKVSSVPYDLEQPAAVWVATTGDDANPGTEDEPFLTIQHAIDILADGTVNVAAGTYSEQVVIDKQLTLNGANADVNAVTRARGSESIVDGGTSTALVISADDVIVDGFTLDGGVTLDDAANPIIGGTISNNIITGADNPGEPIKAQNGIRVGWDDGVGVDDVTIEDNTITNSLEKGIRFANPKLGDGGGTASNITISGNEIKDNGSAGIETYGPGPNTIINNIISDNDGNGINLKFDDGDVVTGNIITNNTGPGITLRQVTNTVVENNSVSGHLSQEVINTCPDVIGGKGSGIHIFDTSKDNTIRFNDISGNNYGIFIHSKGDLQPSGNSINFNNISGNINYGILNALVDPLTSVDATKNWWGDESGPAYTSNPDGAGDAISDNTLYNGWLGVEAGTSPMTFYVNNSSANGIQDTIDVASDGDTINLSAGTYDQNIDINKRITLQGAGSDFTGTVLQNTISPTIVDGATYRYKSVVIVSANGTEGNPILIKDLMILPQQDIVGGGYQLPGILPRPGLQISYLSLDNIRFVGTQSEGTSESGLALDGSAGLDHFTVTGCLFTDMAYGMIYHATSGLTVTAQYVEVNNTTFNGNSIKGFYAERLSDATFTDVTVTNSGNTTLSPDWADPWNAGIDINLKYGSYQNLVFNNLTVTGNGIGSTNGAGLMVKARGTGSDSSYSSNPAHLDGVMVNGGTFTGNEAGIRFGEPGKDNTEPTNITVNNASITGNTQFGLSNVLAGVTVDATDNWWGSANGPTHAGNTYRVGSQGSAVIGSVKYAPWLDAESGESFAPVTIGEEGFASIQAAIDFADPGNTINVAAGMYEENVVVDRSLTLQGENRDTTEIKFGYGDYPSEPPLIISADEVTVSEFTIRSGPYIEKALGATGGYAHTIIVTGDSALLTDLHVIKEPLLTYNNQPRIGGSAFLLTPGLEGFTLTDSTVVSEWNGIYAREDGSNIVVRNVDFTYPGEYAIMLKMIADATIEENTFTCTADKLGVLVTRGSSGIDIADNQFVGSGSSAGSHTGILLQAYAEGTMGDVTILSNGISDFNTGILVEDVATSGISIHYNNITGNAAYGVNYLGLDTVDATNNWWGTGTAATVATMVSGNVAYDPWHLKQMYDVTIGSITQNSIVLSWTTDGAWNGEHYDIRYSTSPITPDNWDSATRRVAGEPKPANTTQGMIIRKLSSGTTYYFGVTLKHGNKSSDISKIVSATTLTMAPVDNTPPGPVTNLAALAGSPATTSVVLEWTATGDDGATGFATRYIIKQSTSVINTGNFDKATTMFNTLTPKASGQNESFTVSRLNPNTTYYFAIKVQDEVPNTSEISNVAAITTAYSLPTVGGIEPATGNNGDERTLTFTGTNFAGAGATVVRLVSGDNVLTLTNVTVSNNTQLTAVVPIGVPTGTYKARVTNNNGTSKLISPVKYIVTEALVPLPVVTNLIPHMAASNTPTNNVRIIGKNLANATAVRINGIDASNISVISNTRITVNVLGLPAGEYDVKVTTPAGTNQVSTVKFVVIDPAKIDATTTEDTTTSGVIELKDTNVIPVQITMTTDNSETAPRTTDADVEISVVIPPGTAITDSAGTPYTGTLNPPRVIKPDESVHTDLPEDAIVIEMGNPEQTIKFSQDFVATVKVTASSKPDIYYYNKDTGEYELAGETRAINGIVYVPGGTVLGLENSTYTIGLLLDHMSVYVASVKSLIPPPPTPPAVGGGGITIPPPPPPGTTDVSGKVTREGVFTRSVTTTSEDELCTLTIPSGTVGLTEELEPLDEITMVIMDEPPPPPEDDEIVGLSYDFGPDGATFDPPITLEYSYDPDDIPDWLDEEDLVIAMWDEDVWNEDTSEWGVWVVLEGCTVDKDTHTITAPVSHFTTFAVIARHPLAPPAPAAFSVTNLTVQPAEVRPKESVTITVSVANTGGTEGSYSVVLKINGVREAEKRVTVAADSIRDVSFTVAKETTGTYLVNVKDLGGSFTVALLPPAPAPVPTVPPEVEVPINWTLLGGIMGVLVAAGLLMFILMRRRAP